MASDNPRYTNDYIIVDITGDQFVDKDNCGRYDILVYVGKMDEFHRMFAMNGYEVFDFKGIDSCIGPARGRLKELETADYESVKDGCRSVIADIPCYNCGEYYISLDESIYPFGHCAFCGEDNEIETCDKCEGYFHSWDMHGNLCENCFKRIMED